MTDTATQVETPAPDANVPEVVETPETPAESSPAVNDADEIVTKAKGVGRRIDELTRNWREAERREAALLKLLEQRSPATPEPVERQDSQQDKTLADFEFDEVKYQSYLRSTVAEEARRAARDELQQERERQTSQQRKSAFQTREAAYAKATPDYMEVTRDPNVPITAQMAEVIADSEDGPALAYHLAKNIDVAESIARLPALAQARELGKIEAKLTYERQQAEEAKKRVSQAPPPPPQIEGANAGTTQIRADSPESDKLSDEEWTRLRERQLKSRKR